MHIKIKENLIAEAEKRPKHLQEDKKLIYVCLVAILVMLGMFGSGHSSAQSRALAPNSEKNQTSAGKS